VHTMILQFAADHGENWIIRDFISFANTMDRRWRGGNETGSVVAYHESDRLGYLEYRAFYEPSVDSSLVGSLNTLALTRNTRIERETP